MEQMFIRRAQPSDFEAIRDLFDELDRFRPRVSVTPAHAGQAVHLRDPGPLERERA